jgi:ubiquinone/menaquinone biosynthesis C-methylase UbiE
MPNERRKFWSRIARKYDAVVDLQIGANTRVLVRERLAREARLGTVVEFGCGTGFYTEVLAGRADTVLATDLAPGMLAVAKQRVKAANVQFQEEDCQKTSLPDSVFDTAFMSLVIQFTDKEKTLMEMRRILKPGGTLIIANGVPGALSTVNRLRWLVRGFYYGLSRHRVKPPKGITRNLITLEDLCDLFIKCGFKIVDTERIRNGSRSSNMPIDYIKAESTLSTKHDSLRQGEVFRKIDGNSLAAHVSLPSVAAALAAATGFFFAAEGAADFRAAGADVHIGDAAIAAAGGEELFGLAEVVGENG